MTLAAAAANEKLQQLSRTDPLTGLTNRRRLEDALAETWQHTDTTAHLTVSVGTATALPTKPGHHTVTVDTATALPTKPGRHDLLRRADEGLCAAKRQGRDRVAAGHPPTRTPPATTHTRDAPPAAIVAPMNAALPEADRIRVLRAEAEYAAVAKSPKTAYGLWCACGIFGGHRFYLGDTARSVAMLFTLGGLGLWTLLDLFFIARRVRQANHARRATIMARYGILEEPPAR